MIDTLISVEPIRTCRKPAEIQGVKGSNANVSEKWAIKVDILWFEHSKMTPTGPSEETSLGPFVRRAAA